jgi:hypothetical protein
VNPVKNVPFFLRQKIPNHMEIRSQSGRLIVFVLLTFFLSLVMSSPSSATPGQIAEKFNSLYKAIEKTDDEARLPSLWTLIDQVVLDHLNSGKGIDSLPQLFTELAGYNEPKTSTRTIIGNAVFYDNPDEEATYSVRTLKVDGSLYALGIYTLVNRYKFKMYPGRLSLYTFRGGSWNKTSAFDGDSPVLVYSFPDALSYGYLVTLERNIYADRQEGHVRTWIVRQGELKEQRCVFNGLVDFSTQVSQSSLVIPYTKFLDGLCEPVFGKRLLYEITFSLNDKKEMICKERAFTPWLETLNDYFEAVNRNRPEKAIRYVHDKSILKNLRKGYCAVITAQDGDLTNGVAFVDIRSMYKGNKPYRIEFMNRDNTWLIRRITELEEKE